jgi:hypothetical protein
MRFLSFSNKKNFGKKIPARSVEHFFQGGDMSSRGNHPYFFCLKNRRTSGDLSLSDLFFICPLT